MTTSFRERYGPWALVAGGSLGLGAAYSRQLAERGLNVVLVAEVDDPGPQLLLDAFRVGFPELRRPGEPVRHRRHVGIHPAFAGRDPIGHAIAVVIPPGHQGCA